MNNLEPHFLAILAAADTSALVLDLLPDGDLVDELRCLNDTQLMLLTSLIDGKHYGTDNITDFMKYTNTVRLEIERIQDKEDI